MVEETEDEVEDEEKIEGKVVEDGGRDGVWGRGREGKVV